MTAKDYSRDLAQLVGRYANAVGRYGPDSHEAHQIRTTHADNVAFLDYADALDRVKRALGGSGIDYPAGGSERR
jgi:hypothetical protein